MAAKKIKPAKGKGVLKGKLPTKRSINLVLVDENKINPLTAILGILLIVVLAGVFSKFLVIDRLDAMAQAQGRVTRLQGDLDSAMDALDNIGDIGETYAHYTLEGMTAAELNQVDRVLVLALVDSILPVVEEGPSEAEIAGILKSMFRDAPATGNDALDAARQRARLDLLEQLVPVPEYIINRWSLTDPGAAERATPPDRKEPHRGQLRHHDRQQGRPQERPGGRLGPVHRLPAAAGRRADRRGRRH